MRNQILCGDSIEVLKRIPDESIHCCVTSPPYFGLRDYGIDGQIGLEETPDEYVAKLVKVFREVRRVLRDDGTLWLNLGDSYCSTAPGTKNSPQPKGSKLHADEWANKRPKTPRGMKPKDLIGIPWMVAFALRADGWYLRQDVIWHKPNPMPESVTDRCGKAHEYIFLFSKSPKYFFDSEAIREPANPASLKRYAYGYGSERQKGRAMNETVPKGDKSYLIERGATRNKRSVWTVTTKPFKGAHFATFPQDLIEPMIKAGSPENGVCATCGSPYVSRKTDTGERTITQQMIDCGSDTDGKYTGQAQKDYASAKAQNASDTKRRILESMSKVHTYEVVKTCDCDTDKKLPAIILDPFMGAGTTAFVAKKLGRDYLGIELNADYIKIAEKRISK